MNIIGYGMIWGSGVILVLGIEQDSAYSGQSLYSELCASLKHVCIIVLLFIC